MKYLGGKSRIAKHILPIILAEKTGAQCYVEPFIGGGSVIQYVTGVRIGADVNPHTIHALTMIKDRLCDIPKNNHEFTEGDYNRHKSAFRSGTSTDIQLTSFAGFAYSFGAKFFGGWRRDRIGKRDYVNEAFKLAERQSPLLNGVNLTRSSYLELDIPENSVIYCDPPYVSTTGYSGTGKFNHAEFWGWCRAKSAEGHKVFISELTAPDDFKPVWSKDISSSVRRDNRGKMREQLFVYCG